MEEGGGGGGGGLPCSSSPLQDCQWQLPVALSGAAPTTARVLPGARSPEPQTLSLVSGARVVRPPKRCTSF